METTQPSPLAPPIPDVTDLQQPAPQKKHIYSSKAFMIFFGILLVTLCTAGAIGYMKLVNNQDILAPQKTAQTALPTMPPLASQGLKSYQNTSNKFELPYPETLKIKEATYGLGITNVELRAPETSETQTPDYQMLTFPKAMGKLIQQDFDEYYAMPDNTEKILKNEETGTADRFVKIRNRTIGNQRAFDFITTASPPDPNELAEIGVYIETGGNIVIISTGEENKAKFEAMLANFKYPL